MLIQSAAITGAVPDDRSFGDLVAAVVSRVEIAAVHVLAAKLDFVVDHAQRNSGMGSRS